MPEHRLGFRGRLKAKLLAQQRAALLERPTGADSVAPLTEYLDREPMAGLAIRLDTDEPLSGGLRGARVAGLGVRAGRDLERLVPARLEILADRRHPLHVVLGEERTVEDRGCLSRGIGGVSRIVFVKSRSRHAELVARIIDVHRDPGSSRS